MASNILRYGEHILLADGREIHLTQSEATILAVLARYHDHVVTYETIESNLWPHDADRPEERAKVHGNVQVHVCRLREKIEPLGMRIEVEWGLGYRLMGELEVDGTIR
jgi:DNA-binding response OmpR family regulator